MKRWILKVCGRDDRGLVQVNQFQEDERASGVLLIFVGLIVVSLLVAGGIVLLVWLWDDPGDGVDPLAGTPWAEEAPEIKWRKDIDGSLQVVAVDGGDWGAIEVTGCVNQNEGAIQAGDRLERCRGQVYIRHLPTGEILWEGSF